MKPVRLLIVDDSPTMRAIIRQKLNADPEIEVIGEAGDPYEARKAIKKLSPDVITLDIEMPKLNGIEFLEKIMRLRPMPVIMVSTLTQNGASATIEALAIGAFDCIGKPTGGDFINAFPNLERKIKLAARSPLSRREIRTEKKQAPSEYEPGKKIIAIGASTGGVEAISRVLESFPTNCPPTVITQHMPESFTKSFAARMNAMCAPEVMEATDGALLTPGRIYVAPGNLAHLEVAMGERLSCKLRHGDLVSGHRPSVDVMFQSVASLGSNVAAALLTGMGRDGASGLLNIRDAGGHTVGQDEATSVVYGMPRAAFELGAVECQLPLSQIGQHLLKLCQAEDRRACA